MSSPGGKVVNTLGLSTPDYSGTLPRFTYRPGDELAGAQTETAAEIGSYFTGVTGIEAGLARFSARGAAKISRLSLRQPGLTNLVIRSGGPDVRSMKVVREIKRGERISDLINEAKALTWSNGLEHALVKLTDGQRVLVSGGADGVRFARGKIKRIYGHTHPTSAPPSRADVVATRVLGQTRQDVYHGGEMTRVRPKYWKD